MDIYLVVKSSSQKQVRLPRKQEQVGGFRFNGLCLCLQNTAMPSSFVCKGIIMSGPFSARHPGHFLPGIMP